MSKSQAPGGSNGALAMIVATASVTLAVGVTVAALTGYLRPREAPVVDTAVEAAPVEVAPVEVAPVEVAPVEVVPVELAPVEETPAVLAVYEPAQSDRYDDGDDDDDDDHDDDDDDDEHGHERQRRGHDHDD